MPDLPDLPEDTEWAEVARFDSLADAEIAKTMLEAYGLSPGLEGANSAHILPGVDPTMHGIVLHVPTPQAEQAILLLKGGPPAPANGDTPPDGDTLPES